MCLLNATLDAPWRYGATVVSAAVVRSAAVGDAAIQLLV